MVKVKPNLLEDRHLCPAVTSSNSYVVDVSKKQGNTLPEDYSRVKEVAGDNSVLLQRQSAASVSYTDLNNEKPQRFKHVADKGKYCPELMGSDYVESMPSPPTI